VATRDEVLAFIKKNYKIQQELQVGDETVMRVVVEGVSNKRSQNVFVGVDHSFFVHSPFAQVGQVSAENVFKAHEGMRLGLSTMAGFYCITANISIQDLDPSEIIVAIELSGKLADDLERKLKLGDVL
jgi:hypothetical protein